MLETLWIISCAAVALVTLLSALRAKAWWIRIWDFPRSQVLAIAIILFTLGIFMLVAKQDEFTPILWIALCILATSAALQTCWFIRLTPLVPKSVLDSSDVLVKHGAPIAPSPSGLRIITANVDYENDDPGSALQQLVHQCPDILALVESDSSWDTTIEQYADAFPWIIKEYRSKGRGMALLSRLPIENSQIRTLVSDDRPSIWADIRIAPDVLVSVCVLHPPPPGLPRRKSEGRVSSKPRDIELDVASSIVSERSDQHWIMAGDFNDVGWSATTLRAKRHARLADPRIGRGMFSTFPATMPFLRYPIDHVLVSSDFRVQAITRLDPIGSDHLPLLIDLELQDVPHIGLSDEHE